MMNRIFVGIASLLSISPAFAIHCPSTTLKCTAINATTGQTVFTGASTLVAVNWDEPSEPEYADRCEAHLSFPRMNQDKTQAFSVHAEYKERSSSIIVSTYSMNCASADVGPCYIDQTFPSDTQDRAMQVGQSFQTKIERFNILLNCKLQ